LDEGCIEIKANLPLLPAVFLGHLGQYIWLVGWARTLLFIEREQADDRVLEDFLLSLAEILEQWPGIFSLSEEGGIYPGEGPPLT
jgi:hypothetical protein